MPIICCSTCSFLKHLNLGVYFLEFMLMIYRTSGVIFLSCLYQTISVYSCSITCFKLDKLREVRLYLFWSFRVCVPLNVSFCVCVLFNEYLIHGYCCTYIVTNYCPYVDPQHPVSMFNKSLFLNII